ncbi:MAG: membrane or secreted protein [Cyclobacteriaceae bacterium]|nr:membrane or secreted protein [Cyclobacteriaceae bacterium]
MNLKLLIILFSFIYINLNFDTPEKFQGAWKSDEGVLILTGNYFSYTAFSKSEFNYTYGGSWKMDEEKIMLSFEFHTQEPLKVGTNQRVEVKINKKSMNMNGTEFSRLDDGKPGKLFGAWLFSNRIRNGEMGTPRSADNPRKTMKILSGTRFQWIAYNSETKEFMGTGGGTFTTKDGKYIENIDFFSRDNSRVGASLEFEYELKGNDWHHKGFSSRGDPIYEIWSLRE